MRLVVLDFDGTMSDAEVEGAPYRTGYLEDLALLAGLPFAEVQAQADRLDAEVAANAAAEGWRYQGQIVAPATVDPYLRLMPVARKILDAAGRLLDETDRARVLDGLLYRYNYRKTITAFRPGAADALYALRHHATWIVTNSDTDAVRAKVRQLQVQSGGLDLGWLDGQVIGHAKKYVIDPAFDAVPERLELPGLSRPVLLRRGHYFSVLDRLRAQAGVGWEDVVVVGDIFELDLSLPLVLGARVGLLCNAWTPSWEQDYLRDHPRGRLLRTVSEIPGFVG